MELFILFIQHDFLSHATLGPSKFIFSWISRKMLQPRSSLKVQFVVVLHFWKNFFYFGLRSYAFFHREQKSFSVWASLHLGDLQFDSKDQRWKHKNGPPHLQNISHRSKSCVNYTQTGHKVRFFLSFLAVTCVLTDSNLCQHCTLTLNMGQQQQHFRD